MHFDYLEEHEMLRDSVRGFLERNNPIALLRKTPPLDPQMRRANFRAEAAQGWTGMLVGEEFGGTNLTIVEAMVVAEEFGRAANASSFAALNAVCHALTASGSAAQQSDILPRLTEGGCVVAWAAGIQGGLVRAERAPDGWRLDGVARFVQDADIAEYLLVDAITPGGWGQFLLPSKTARISVRDVVSIDVGRRFCDVTFAGVVAPTSALLDDESMASFTHQKRIAAILVAADSVGLASRLLEMTVAYAKERVAFGKPIGAFQAVKHRCADMLIQIENARVATWYAAIAMRDKRADMAEAASIAKFYATEAGAFVAGNALQLHGGIGMTWEHDLHFFYKRAKANELLWGSNASHREIVAGELDI